MKGLSVGYKLVLCAVIVFALQKELFAGGNFVAGALYYFTIQSNLLTAISLLLLIALPERHALRSIFRGMALIAITLTGIVYNFVLYRVFTDWGGAGYTFSRTVLHVAAPLGFIADWLLFDRRKTMRWPHLFLWLIYPAVYCAVSFYIAIRKGTAIYFFFDVSRGIMPAVWWSGLLFCLLIVIGALYIGIDQIKCRRGDQTDRTGKKLSR